MSSSMNLKRKQRSQSGDSPQSSQSAQVRFRQSAAEPLNRRFVQMRMDSTTPNPLLSTAKASDSQVEVQLHPLVILIISDYITRHTLRQQKGPVVGAIIGAQNGREITMEFAFECKVEENKDGDVVMDVEWFQDRLQQYKDVHKSPALDLVGWFALAPTSGPQPHHLPIQVQLLEQYNESALFLAFHPESVADGTSGSKLPITIYEPTYEASGSDGDKHMQSSDEAAPQHVLRFKELPYTVETGEAEMISVDFVARGGGNAAVTNGTSSTTSITTKPDTKAKGKGKGKADTASASQDVEPNLDILSQEDEELISTLTAKANAIRMLNQRISLLKTYLHSIPPCYLNTPPTPSDQPTEISPHPQISHPILRQISATLARIPLLTPSSSESTANPSQKTDTTTFTHQAAQQRSDVALISLLGSLGSTIRSAQDMGKKASVMERARTAALEWEKMRQPPGSGGADFSAGGGGGGKWGRQGGYPTHSAGQGGMLSEAMETQGDEGYVDDYGDDEDEMDERRGGGGGSSIGGVSLSAQGSSTTSRFMDDEEMT